jgi:two-component system cell cycle response regulator CtrA
MRILVVEDETNTAKSIEMMLRSQSYVCDTTSLGEDGLELAKIYDYDIILLDLMLPDLDGFEIVRRLRLAEIRTPILIISALAEANAKSRAFGLGADEYLPKPFNPRELLARIQAIVRRFKGHCNSVLHFGKLSINLDTHTAMISGQPLHLTQKEYCILELLALREGVIQSKDSLMNHLYGGMDEPQFRIIDVYVCKLRRKLAAASGESYIRTDWGRGYVFRGPANMARTAAHAPKERH